MCKWIKSGSNRIDPCLREGIKNMNWAGRSIGIKTLACCCGHGKYPPTIIIQKPDGTIRDFMSDIMIPRKRKFYRKDSQGVYYIPEISLVNDKRTEGPK